MNNLLRQTATIQRRDVTIVGPDPFATIAEVPCRIRSGSNAGQGAQRVLELPIGLFTVTHVIYLPAGTDVSESDRISEVHDADGNVLASDLRIGLITKIGGADGRSHHLELACSAWKDPVPA